MSQNKYKKRDADILSKISNAQKELSDGIKDYKVMRPSDLSNLNPLIRRGMMHVVGDIFELTTALTDSTKTDLKLDAGLIKFFRNAVSHNYGIISDTRAFTYVQYCASKEMVNNVRKALENVKTQLRAPRTNLEGLTAQQLVQKEETTTKDTDANNTKHDCDITDD